MSKFPIILNLSLVALFVLLACSAVIDRCFNSYPPIIFKLPVPEQDGWRSISADQPDTIAVGWNARGEGSTTMNMNLTTGQWTRTFPNKGWGSINAKFYDMMTHPESHPFSLEQRAAIKKWVETLPPSDADGPGEPHVRIAVNLDGAERIYEYTDFDMISVMDPFCQIMGWHQFENLE